MTNFSLKSFFKTKSYKDFELFQKGAFAYLDNNGTRLHVDPNDLASMRAIRDAWDHIWTVCSNSGTINREDRLKRAAVRVDFTDKMVSFFQTTIFTNQNFTEVEIGGMGFPAKSSIVRAKAFDYTEKPNLTITTSKNGIVKFAARNNAGHLAMPSGAKLLEVRYALTTTEPAKPTDYTNSVHLGRTKGLLMFDPKNDGAMVYIIARWCTGDNQDGVFSSALPVGISS